MQTILELPENDSLLQQALSAQHRRKDTPARGRGYGYYRGRGGAPVGGYNRPRDGGYRGRRNHPQTLPSGVFVLSASSRGTGPRDCVA